MGGEEATYVHRPTGREAELGLEGLVRDTVPWACDEMRDLDRLGALVYNLMSALARRRYTRSGTCCSTTLYDGRGGERLERSAVELGESWAS